MKNVVIRYTLFGREIGRGIRFDYQQSKKRSTENRAEKHYGGTSTGPGLRTVSHYPRTLGFSVFSLG